MGNFLWRLNDQGFYADDRVILVMGARNILLDPMARAMRLVDEWCMSFDRIENKSKLYDNLDTEPVIVLLETKS